MQSSLTFSQIIEFLKINDLTTYERDWLLLQCNTHQEDFSLAETPSGAQVPAGDGPSGEGLGSEGVTAPPESVAPPSEAPSEVGAKSDGKSEKGTSKNKADSKPGLFDSS